MQNRRVVSLNALRAFEAAARRGRMTEAADELSVTHGAVSRHIRHLEESLGVALFTGPKNRLVLTRAGEHLLPELTGAFDRIEMAVRAISDEQNSTLDVSCLGTFTMRWLIPRLHRFRAWNSTIEVRLTAADDPVNFERERYDVAIRVSDHPLPLASSVTELFKEDVGPVMSPALASDVELNSADDLLKLPLLHTATRPNAWTEWVQQVGIAANAPAGQRFEHFYFLLEAAVSGLGVAIAPWPLARDDVTAGRLIAPFGFVASGRSYVAVTRGRREHKVEDFCAWLTEEAKSMPTSPSSTLQEWIDL